MLSYIFVVKNQLFRNSLNMAFSQFSPKKWNRLQFYKRNPFENESDQKKSCQKIAIAFHFTKEIHLKFFGRIKKIEITFNFTKKIPLKMNRTKKKVITTKGRWESFYFWEYFSKTLSKRVILKILYNISNLSQI